MNRMTLVALVGAVTLGGCAQVWHTEYGKPLKTEASREWRLAGVTVDVPQALTVSDRDSLMPNADIVWHGDPAGDRKAQVATLMQTAVAQGAAGLAAPKGRSVTLAATVTQFHVLTPRAVELAPRGTGVDNIGFTLEVRDDATGKVLAGPQKIEADIPGLIRADGPFPECHGADLMTCEKPRIIDHVAKVTAAWLGIGPSARHSFLRFGR